MIKENEKPISGTGVIGPDINPTDRPVEKKSADDLYDVDAGQILPLEVTVEDGLTYDINHHYKPLTSGRYFQFTSETSMTLEDAGEDLSFQRIVALGSLWDDLIEKISDSEGDLEIDQDVRDTWKDQIDVEQEKAPSMQSLLTYVIVKDDADPDLKGRRRISKLTNHVITGEAFFNGRPVSQVHTLKRKTRENSKEFERIQKIPIGKQRRLNESDDIRLTNRDKAKCALYDKMRESTKGYVNDKVADWHKPVVIDYLFGSSTDLKKQSTESK